MSKKRRASDHIKFVDEVTALHGFKFFERLRLEVRECGYCGYDSIGAAGLMRWPEDDGEGDEDTPAQARYRALETEILARTFRIAGEALRAAFVLAATEITERERKRQRGRKRES